MESSFLNKLTEIVHNNLSNDRFGVTELVKEMGMSRSLIYRHLKKLTNKSISQFLRNTRLEKAMEMLLNTDEPASEIAFRVGFSSPAYFNHCFHEHYGFPPGEVRKRALHLNGTETTTSIPEPKAEQSSLSETTYGKWKRNKKKLSGYIFAFVVLLSFVSFLVYLVYFVALNNKWAKAEKSIIVLPFKNLSDDPVNEYFADGIREDILNNLYWITSLRIVSNTTAENFREYKLTAHEIAHQINVNYVLEGSVRRYSNNVRINIQLIDAKSDEHLWSDSFDRDLSDIIHVQNEIACRLPINLKRFFLTMKSGR